MAETASGIWMLGNLELLLPLESKLRKEGEKLARWAKREAVLLADAVGNDITSVGREPELTKVGARER